MINLRDLTPALDACRQRTPRVLERYGSYGDGGNGVFSLPSPRGGGALLCIASNGDGWDHVSVSLPDRCPNWPETGACASALSSADGETTMAGPMCRPRITSTIIPIACISGGPTTAGIIRAPGPRSLVGPA